MQGEETEPLALPGCAGTKTLLTQTQKIGTLEKQYLLSDKGEIRKVHTGRQSPENS